ncbi:MAG: tail fiber domain-containing protein [Solirubrobacteraceae bacterium]
MSLRPEIFGTSSGAALTDSTSDLARRLAALERTSGTVGAGSLQAGVLAPGSVVLGNLAAGSVTTGALVAGSVTATVLAAGAVTTITLAAGAITTEKLAAGSVTTATLAAGSVTAATIAAGTITATNIAAGTITGSLMAAGTITGDKLIVGAVTVDKMTVANLAAISSSMGTLTAGLIRIGATAGAKTAIGTGISTSAGIKDGIVLTDAANNITFWADAATGNLTLKGTLQAGSSGLGNIAGQINGSTAIVDNTIPGGKLVIDSISTRELAASSVTAVALATNSVIAGKINAGAVTTATLAVGAVTADKVTLSLGGGNYLRNGAFDAGLSAWDAETSSAAAWSTTPNGGFGGGASLRYIYPGDSGVHFRAQDVTLPVGDYIAHARVITRNGTGPRSARLSPGFGIAGSTSAGVVLAASSPIPPGNSGDYVRIEMRFRVTIAGVVRLYIQAGDVDGNGTQGTFDYDEIMLERGDVPTAFTVVGPRGVTSTEILPGSITTGSLRADAIDGMVITGTTLRTAASGARVQLDSTGLRKINADGTVPVILGVGDGLDLLAGLAGGPPADRRIRWMNAGVRTSDIWGFATEPDTLGPGVAGTVINAFSSSARISKIQIFARDSGETVQSALITEWDQPGGTGSVFAFARNTSGGQFNRTIINSAGASSFQSAASEPRMKKYIKPLPAGALGLVRDLTPVTFQWRASAGEEGPQAGFLADQIAEKYPEAATTLTDPDGTVTRGVLHAPILALHNQALTELDARLAVLERRPST